MQHPGIWRGNQRAQTAEEALPTGFAALDALLPGGGWPRGALTELLIGRQGIGELRLLIPALARLSEADGWLAWVAPPYVPYAAALTAVGIDLKRLVVAKPPSEADAWWTCRSCRGGPTCACGRRRPGRPRRDLGRGAAGHPSPRGGCLGRSSGPARQRGRSLRHSGRPAPRAPLPRDARPALRRQPPA